MDNKDYKTGEIIPVSKSPVISSYTKAREQGGLLIKKYRFSGITSILMAPLLAVGVVLFLIILFFLLLAAGIYLAVRFMLALPQPVRNDGSTIEKRTVYVKKDVDIL